MESVAELLGNVAQERYRSHQYDRSEYPLPCLIRVPAASSPGDICPAVLPLEYGVHRVSYSR